MRTTLLATGSREFRDAGVVHSGLIAAARVLVDAPTRLVTGNGRGADQLVRRIALVLWPALELVDVDAEWNALGRAAGPIRNQKMVDLHRPDLAVAYLVHGLPCRGTRDCIDRCIKAGIRVLVMPG